VPVKQKQKTAEKSAVLGWVRRYVGWDRQGGLPEGGGGTGCEKRDSCWGGGRTTEGEGRQRVLEILADETGGVTIV